MKIIEALKKLKVIEKRITSNAKDITAYASVLSNEKPAFGTEEEQRREVSQLLQSSEDLGNEYLDLKRKIEKTNLTVEVEMNGKKYSISDLLVIKRKLAKMMMDTYSALNTQNADHRLMYNKAGQGQMPTVVQLYDEAAKNKKLRSWQEMYDQVDSRLEVINATEDIVE